MSFVDAHYFADQMEFTFNNICVSVEGKQILQDVSGSLLPGEFLAIMGPSGE